MRGRIQFEYFAALTILLTYGLIVLGGTVRATDSGTACPDWPLCHGRVLPRIEEHVLIEYSHRLVASIVGLFIIAMVIWAWRRAGSDPLVRGAAVLAIVLLAVQVLVGAATVNTETDASVVALHLSIALTLFATLITLALAASRERAVASGRLPLLMIAVALGAFALVISGAYVSQEGAGLSYPDWPLFDGKLTPSGGRLGDLHYLHRILAGGLGFLLLGLAVATWRSERRPAVRGAVALARCRLRRAGARGRGEHLVRAADVAADRASRAGVGAVGRASVRSSMVLSAAGRPTRRWPFGAAQDRLT